MIGLFPTSINPYNRNRRSPDAPPVGSQLAAREFTNAMLRFLDGESLALFVPDSEIESAIAEAGVAQSAMGTSAPLLINGLSSLGSALLAERDIALHELAGPILSRNSFVRSEYGSKPFPITCVTYGLSPNILLWDFFTRLLLTPTLACDSIICTSQSAKVALVQILHNIGDSLGNLGLPNPQMAARLDVLPLGVDTDIFRPRDRADCRRLLGLPQDKTILLHFGRIDPATKGDPAPLIRAFKQLTQSHGNSLLLVLAGMLASDHVDRHIRQTAEQLGIARQVEIRRTPPTMDAPLYYSAADIFVTLTDTLQESFGLAPVEAMSSAIPVVVSDWDGYRDTVVHGETGFLVRTRWASCDGEVSRLSPLIAWDECHLRLAQSVAADVGDLVKYLDLLIACPEQRVEMGEKARTHVESHLSWSAVIQAHQALWSELRGIARTLAMPPAGWPATMTMSYYQTFCHYASEQLDGASRLQLTPSGANVCRRREKLTRFGVMEQVLNDRRLATILNYVRLTGAIGYNLSVEEICRKVATRGLSREDVLTHLMWLLKQGFLAVQ